MQHIVHGPGDPEEQRADSAGHGQGFLMAVLQDPAEQMSAQPADDDRCCVDNGSGHSVSLSARIE